jgi:hypothetical protein
MSLPGIRQQVGPNDLDWAGTAPVLIAYLPRRSMNDSHRAQKLTSINCRGQLKIERSARLSTGSKLDSNGQQYRARSLDMVEKVEPPREPQSQDCSAEIAQLLLQKS